MSSNLFDAAPAAIQQNMIRDVQAMVRHETGRTIDADRAEQLARTLLARAKSREALYHVSTDRLRRLVEDDAERHHATRKTSTEKRTYQYRAVVVGKGLLLGGTKRHVSSWFKTKKEADDWAWAISTGNEAAGRSIALITIERRHGGMVELTAYPGPLTRAIKWAPAGKVKS